jgi:hypothetical protein
MLCQCDVEPNNYLVFEDEPLCVAAVKTAGMQVFISCHAYFAPFNGRLSFSFFLQACSDITRCKVGCLTSQADPVLSFFFFCKTRAHMHVTSQNKIKDACMVNDFG